MNYIIAGLAGFVYAAVLGIIKYILLWRPMINGKRRFNAFSVTATQLISMTTNFLILLAIYFLRPIWPYSFVATAVGAAISLSLVGRLMSLRETHKLDHSEEIVKSGSSLPVLKNKPCDDSNDSTAFGDEN